MRSITNRFATFSRLIRHDMRATGLSSRAATLPNLETQVQDAVAVLDAVGSRSTVILGAGPGAHTASLFAATYPGRTRALVLWDLYVWAGDAFQPSDLDLLSRTWGTEASAAAAMARVAPSMIADREFLKWYSKMQRHFVPPDVAADLLQSAIDTDIRPVLPAIHVPTLVLARGWPGHDDDRKVGEMIEGSTFVLLEGEDRATFAGDQDDLVDATMYWCRRRRSPCDRCRGTRPSWPACHFGCPLSAGKRDDLEKVAVGIAEVERADAAGIRVPVRQALRSGRRVLDAVLPERVGTPSRCRSRRSRRAGTAGRSARRSAGIGRPFGARNSVSSISSSPRRSLTTRLRAPKTPVSSSYATARRLRRPTPSRTAARPCRRRARDPCRTTVSPTTSTAVTCSGRRRWPLRSAATATANAQEQRRSRAPRRRHTMTSAVATRLRVIAPPPSARPRARRAARGCDRRRAARWP